MGRKIAACAVLLKALDIRQPEALPRHGQEALDTLEQGALDLMIMDIQMPVMDGREATRRIRQDPRWRALPVLGLTAHAMRGDRERCLAAGMDEYIAKPIQPSVLLAAVHQLPCGAKASVSGASAASDR